MAKLINVIKDNEGKLEKRQLPLVIDDKLTMVLDLIEVDFMCECPKIWGKDKELFLKKFSMLNGLELEEAFKVSCKRLLDIVSEIVPCVGCRRSVERLFHQMKTGPGRSALYPLVVTQEGVLVLSEELYKWPSVIGAMFHNHVSKLNNLSTSWNRSKKSSRCTLHSLDAQRYVRPPLGSGWRTLWDCMVPFCKQEVATIDIAQLLSTLETYLQKHRFCTECRTKVMKAYSLLVDEPEECKGDGSNSETSTCPSPCEHNHGDHTNADEHCSSGTTVKEKGFIPSLYAGIRRCSPNNHIHVDQRTDYIMGLILAAEPELLGNRRERHAKTLEIAQEEVLVCVGLCLYERVHRIQLRLREEQTTCQLLALVAINALSTNFQLAVEMKQGISQLELLFQEFNREDRLKQRRKQVRKLKKRRKKEKERKNAVTVPNSSGEAEDDAEKASDDDEEEEDDDDHKDEDDSDDADENELIKCLIEKNKKHVVDENDCNVKPFFRTSGDRIMQLARSNIIMSKNKEDSCYCNKYENTSNGSTKSKEIDRNKALFVEQMRLQLTNSKNGSRRSFLGDDVHVDAVGLTKPRNNSSLKLLRSRIDQSCRTVNDFSDTCSNSSGSSVYSRYNDKENMNNSCEANSNNSNNENINNTVNSSEPMISISWDDCANVHNNDCGYSSAGISSSNGSDESSVDSSEVACSEGFCNHDGSEDCNFDLRNNGGGEAGGHVKWKSHISDPTKNSYEILNSTRQTLQQMLSETSAAEREPNFGQNVPECTIPVEVIQRYKSCMGSISEKREQLRRQLRSSFAQLCSAKQQAKVLPAV